MNFKSILACAALLIGIGTATAAVESEVVGYTTVTLKKGYNMLAVNFESLTSEDGISIQDLGFTLEAGFTGGTNGTRGDQIQVYDAQRGEYTTYFLYNNERRPEDGKNGKWCKSNGEVAAATFKSGDSFWFRKRGENDATISIAGAVSIQEVQAISIVKGYTMIGNAFPINFNPNDLGADYWMAAIKSGAVGGTNGTRGDQIQVYDAQRGEYTTYFLYNNERRPEDGKNGKWCKSNGTEMDATAEFLPMGRGAWYFHRGDGFTLTTPTPLK